MKIEPKIVVFLCILAPNLKWVAALPVVLFDFMSIQNLRNLHVFFYKKPLYKKVRLKNQQNKNKSGKGMLKKFSG